MTVDFSLTLVVVPLTELCPVTLVISTGAT